MKTLTGLLYFFAIFRHIHRAKDYTRTLVLILSCLVSFSTLLVQNNKRANIWYFGYNAGLNFNNGFPQPLINGATWMWEGCATICDEHGNLLFYTDGKHIWNRNHMLMPEAIELGGHNSASQSGIIIPHPGDPNRYYVFSVDAYEADNIKSDSGDVQYAIVDMTLNNGLGGLISKNNPLLKESTEKLTAVRHCNNQDFWVIVHEVNSNVFRSYLINEKGLNLDYQESPVGQIHPSGEASIGYLKASPDGKKLAIAARQDAFVELFDFNNATGKIDKSTLLKSNDFYRVYGVEFSPNGKVLYVSLVQSYPRKVFQLDLSKSTAVEILASKTVLDESYSINFGALQNGPDGRIYMAVDDSKYLAVINSPNELGQACEYSREGVYLGGKWSGIGLPNLITSYFRKKLTVEIEKKQEGCNIILKAATESNVADISYQWFQDGKAIAGAIGIEYKLTSGGQYKVQIKENGNCITDTASSKTETILYPEANPTTTAFACGQFVLQANANSAKFEWIGPGIGGNRSKQDTIHVTSQATATVYTLKVFYQNDPSCYIEKEVLIAFTSPKPYLHSKQSYTTCQDSLLLEVSPTSDWDTFKWLLKGGITINNNRIVAKESGEYIIIAQNTLTGCESRDTVKVSLRTDLPAPPVITSPINVCQGEKEVNLLANGENIEWFADIDLNQKVASGNRYIADVSSADPGLISYYVTQKSTDGCLSDPAKVDIEIMARPKMQIVTKDIHACFLEGGKAIVEISNSQGPYQWYKSGDPAQINSGSEISIDSPGQYIIKVTNVNSCSSFDTVSVIESCSPSVFLPDAFTPNGDGLNDEFELKGSFIDRFDLTIFNRWGEVIFHKLGESPLQHGGILWDGTYKGMLVPAGQYAYKLIIWSSASATIRKEGKVQVIR